MERLRNYFKEQLPGMDVRPIVACFTAVKEVNKGDLLVSPGQHTSFLAFIDSGAFRVYFLNDKAQEVTSWFSFTNMFITDLLSYYKDVPARQYIEAIEDSRLFMARKVALDELYGERPEYGAFGRGFAERGMVRLMERMMSLQSKTAEERYREILAQPRFMEKIPLKYLATYLGITDTSLSRIRRNIR